jgi:hypothetical protein
VTGIVASEDPGPSAQIVNVNIIEPDAFQILAADDKKFIPGNGGEMGITGFGRRNKRIFI